MLEIVRTLSDNLAYLVWNQGPAICIDPGEADPILELGIEVGAVLLTHHHSDHVGGSGEFGCPVWGPADPRMPPLDREIAGGERFSLCGIEIEAIATPGHTKSHLVYYLPKEGILFTGDTLFVGGCGRLFEGTAREMWQSLVQIAQLPKETQICCGHDYTAENFRFARTIDDRMKEQPAVSTTLEEEIATNPFLRPLAPGFEGDPVAYFADLRRRKDQF